MNSFTNLLSNAANKFKSPKSTDDDLKEREQLIQTNDGDYQFEQKTNSLSPKFKINFNKSQSQSQSQSQTQTQTLDYFTDYGTQRITINGDIKSGKPIIMTYHDIGINHCACFLSFFNMVQSDRDSIFQYFTVIHIDAPGHHYDPNDKILNKKRNLINNNNNDNNNNNIFAYDLLELCTQIEEIRSKLEITEFIAFGIGSSCNIWTYYGINYSHNLRGLILLNPHGGSASWREYIFDKLISAFGGNRQFISDTIISSLLSRYFPTQQSQETYDYFLNEFNKMDKISVIQYFRGFVRRNPFNQKQLNKIKCKTLIICGEYSRFKNDTISFQKMMPRRNTSFVLMQNAGFLLTESDPQKLVSSIDLFFQSLGYTMLSLENKYGKVNDDGFDTVKL